MFDVYLYRATLIFAYMYTYGDYVLCAYIYKGWRRPRGCLIFTGHFLQKNPIIRGSFVDNDSRIQASCGVSPPYRSVGSL